MPPKAELLLQNVPDQWLNRTVARRTAVVGLLGLSASWTVWSISYTPEKPKSNSPESSSFSLFPGSIEKKIDGPFMNASPGQKNGRENGGHGPWMLEAVTKNPLLLSLTKDFVQYAYDELSRGRRLKLGTALAYSIGGARAALTKLDKSQISPRTNLDIEVIHHGIFPVAILATPWFNKQDLELFGFPKNVLEENRFLKNIYWDEQRIGRDGFPRLFGNGITDPPGKAPHNSGEDRMMHFVNHLLITFVYRYSSHYGLHEHTTIPLGLRALILKGRLLGNFRSHEDEALFFSEKVGGAYELSNLKDTKNWPIINPVEQISEGPFDPMAESDYKANRLGEITAIALFLRAFNYRSLDPVFEELNDPKFADFRTLPHLQSLFR